MAKAIMIQGTMSNVGKSLIAAGLCRIFARDGYRTAPFKSQNMALNSYITDEGLEMGRAQVLQAQAAGIEPKADMNPILLKPTSDVGSQVIVRGVPIGTMRASQYFTYKKQLIPVIRQCYQNLCREYDIVVIEGAGSPAEINLNQDDIVNMGMAAMADAPVLLVGDIDRGGVFAQLYGTVLLLNEEDRARVKGLIINKFRGDRSILEPGLHMLDQLCQVPVLGVAPYIQVDLEDEDSLSAKLEEQGGQVQGQVLAEIGVIRFPRLSNFTDFDALRAIPGVRVRYVSEPGKLGEPDLVVLPGTKNTMEDLLWMRQNGLEAAVCKLASRQVPVWGICGGYQMLGEILEDPKGVESGGRPGKIRGMGLLPLSTVFEQEKVRTRVSGSFGRLDGALKELSGLPVQGYEIHMGRTVLAGGKKPWETAVAVSYRQEPEICRPAAYLMEEGGTKAVREDGWNRGNVYGTYVHGVFDQPETAKALVQALASRKGLDFSKVEAVDYGAYREAQLDKLEQALRQSLDLEAIYQILGLPGKRRKSNGYTAGEGSAK